MIWLPNICFNAYYLQAKALVDPFAYETYIEEQKQRKLEEQRASRITVNIILLKLVVFLQNYLSYLHLITDLQRT